MKKQRKDSLVEFSIRFLNLLHGGFFPPVPEVQVPGVEQADTTEGDQEADTEICGIKGGYGNIFRQLQRVSGRHALPPGTHRHI